MKQVVTSKGTFLFVEVPDDAYKFGFRSGHFSYQLPDMEFEAKLLPDVRLKNKGKLTFICTTKNVTEEQAAMFGICAITKDGKMYKYGVVANDGFPAAQGEKGWCWSGFEETLQQAIKKLLLQKQRSTKRNYAIIQKL